MCRDLTARPSIACPALALVAALTILLAPLAAPARANGELPHTLTYALDWSDVPEWVVRREVTLVVTVGPASDVAVLADGVPIRRAFDRSAGTATFTTGASLVEVRVWGGNPAAAGYGEVRKATLRGDKRWAYSLTLDDGYENQYANGARILRQYGYQGTIAVVGGWIGQNKEGRVYLSPAQLQALVAEGWGLANHSYSHRTLAEFPNSTQALNDIQAANQAIMAAVPGYRPLVFTAPFVDASYNALVAANVGTLGLRLLQTLGYQALRVDHINWQPNGFLAMGRLQVPHDGSQFDAMHRYAVERGETWWLSLHSHGVESVCDCVETSTDILYRTYGAGGSDEVWVAPSEVVYQYLLARDYVRVTRQPGAAPPAAAPTAQREPLTSAASSSLQATIFQEGYGGYHGATDTHLDSSQPTRNFALNGSLLLTTNWSKVGLLRFELGSLPTGSRIIEARLELLTAGTSGNYACVSAYPLLRPWNHAQATWVDRTSGQAWSQAGAAGVGTDRAAQATDVRQFVNGSEVRFTIDLTAAVQAWVDRPADNWGVVLSLERTATSVYYNIYSSDYPTVSKRPRLLVTYLLPGVESLGGQVLLPGRTARAEPLEVVLCLPGQRRVAYRASVTTDEVGRFTLSGLAPGAYDLYLRTRQSLWAVERGVVAGGQVTVGPLCLGDIDQDGLIGSGDFELLRASYRTLQGDARYDARADLNGDGAVNIHDFSTLAANYGRQAEAEP